ncbi:Os09g0558850, partial [Oryza sativa Japonica Group]
AVIYVIRLISSELQRQVDLLPIPAVAPAAAAAVGRWRRWRRHVVILLRRLSRRGVAVRRRRPEEAPGDAVEAVDCPGRRRRRRRRRHGGGHDDVTAALGERALELVRVLVASQRLRAEELAVAVVAGEGLPWVDGGGGGRGSAAAAAVGRTPARRGLQHAQVEVDAAVDLRRLALH